MLSRLTRSRPLRGSANDLGRGRLCPNTILTLQVAGGRPWDAVAETPPKSGVGFAEPPTGQFPVVTLIFVLNVLPTAEARLEVLRRAVARLAPDGVLIVATRSSSAVRNEPARRGWRASGDGFVSHEGCGTFQYGMDIEELVGLGEMLGLRPQGPLPTVRHASLVALTRRPATAPNG